MVFTFSDELISHIAKLVQMGILTGTDVIDHFRMIRVVVEDDQKLNIDPQYVEIFNSQIDKMLKEVEEITFNISNLNDN